MDPGAGSLVVGVVMTCGTLTIPVYDWDDAYGKPAPYIVSSTPNEAAAVLWDGRRWIELSHEVMAAVVAQPENVDSPST
jgi:hypothetical protein